MTLSDLYNLLLKQADETSSSVPLDTAVLWFNECQSDLEDDLRLEASWSPTIVAGTGEYSLPADWLRLYRLAWGTTLLEETTLDQLIDDQVDLTDTGEPTHFYFWNGKVGFYPIPDATVTTNPTLYYFKKPATLSSSSTSTVPDVPGPYQTLLVDFALGRYHETQQEPDLELQAMQKYQAGRQKMVGSIVVNSRGSYPTVRQVMGW